MANFLSPILRPFGLDPTEQYDTAAAGAREAQGQANALSQLQWQRQMQGLQGALGYVNNLQSLYNQIYSPGGGKPAAGGAPTQGPSPGAMAALSSPPPATPPNNQTGQLGMSQVIGGRRQ